MGTTELPLAVPGQRVDAPAVSGERASSGSGRRRRRRGPRREGAAAVSAPRRLDLERPKDEALSSAERREMEQHLAFLRRWKGALRLSLNSNEDLVVNGVRPIPDRGFCRHLLAKVDRVSVQRAIAREPLSSSPEQRAELLAGVVRLDPDPSLLLEYLGALSASDRRREAARGFSFTVDRLDFEKMGNVQLGQLLQVVKSTFVGPDQARALFGLFENPSFVRALDSLPAEQMKDELLPSLFALYQVVSQGGPGPAEEGDDRRLKAGLAHILDAPAEILGSYPEAMRVRLVELASRYPGEESFVAPLRLLINTLPAGDLESHRLREKRAEDLIRAQDLGEARRLVDKLARAEERGGPFTRRRAALAWPALGRVLAKPGPNEGLKEAFWPEENAFVLVREGRPDDAGRFQKEARLHNELVHPFVLPLAFHDLAPDGRPYIVLAGLARRSGALFERSLGDTLLLLQDLVELLSHLAAVGVLLPDLAEHRFLLGPDRRLLLGDSSLCVRKDPTETSTEHASSLRSLAHAKLSKAAPSHPLLAKLERSLPLPVLHRELIRARSSLR